MGALARTVSSDWAERGDGFRGLSSGLGPRPKSLVDLIQVRGTNDAVSVSLMCAGLPIVESAFSYWLDGQNFQFLAISESRGEIFESWRRFWAWISGFCVEV